MGLTMRNGGKSFQVSIQPLVKTCAEESGILPLDLPDGTRIVALAHCYFPSHDRSIMEGIKSFLADAKPDIIFLLGGIVHEDAFKGIVDDDDVVKLLVKNQSPPELIEIRQNIAGVEKRFLKLAELCGNFIKELQAVSDADIIYIPSATGVMPNEIDIMRFVLGEKRRIDSWRGRNPKEADEGEDIPPDLAKFLGLNAHPRIHVLPFGAAALINDDMLLLVGDFRRRNPGTAAKVEFEQRGYNVVRGFDGKVSSGHETRPSDSFPGPKRRYHQWHEVGNIYDVSQGLGYVRTYDRRAIGFFAGKVVGGRVMGQVVIPVPGEDGRRSFVVWGQAYDEPAKADKFKRLTIKVNLRSAHVRAKMRDDVDIPALLDDTSDAAGGDKQDSGKKSGSAEPGNKKSGKQAGKKKGPDSSKGKGSKKSSRKTPPKKRQSGSDPAGGDKSE